MPAPPYPPENDLSPYATFVRKSSPATQRIPEKDWKRIRKVQQEKLAMVCRSILDVIGRLVAQSQGAEHEPYLKIWDTIREEDKKIGLSSFRAFSNAASPQGIQFTGLCACCSR